MICGKPEGDICLLLWLRIIWMNAMKKKSELIENVSLLEFRKFISLVSIRSSLDSICMDEQSLEVNLLLYEKMLTCITALYVCIFTCVGWLF